MNSHLSEDLIQRMNMSRFQWWCAGEIALLLIYLFLFVICTKLIWLIQQNVMECGCPLTNKTFPFSPEREKGKARYWLSVPWESSLTKANPAFLGMFSRVGQIPNAVFGLHWPLCHNQRLHVHILGAVSNLIGKPSLGIKGYAAGGVIALT